LQTILGLLGIVAYGACVIGVAAAITWVVVKVSPAEKEEKPKPAEPDADSG
jgi:hypothetical protein